ncbi:hypothetical protein ACHAWC_011518 [Mediolabrus comicus]
MESIAVDDNNNTNSNAATEAGVSEFGGDDSTAISAATPEAAADTVLTDSKADVNNLLISSESSAEAAEVTEVNTDNSNVEDSATIIIEEALPKHDEGTDITTKDTEKNAETVEEETTTGPPTEIANHSDDAVDLLGFADSGVAEKIITENNNQAEISSLPTPEPVVEGNNDKGTVESTPPSEFDLLGFGVETNNNTTQDEGFPTSDSTPVVDTEETDDKKVFPDSPEGTEHEVGAAETALLESEVTNINGETQDATEAQSSDSSHLPPVVSGGSENAAAKEAQRVDDDNDVGDVDGGDNSKSDAETTSDEVEEPLPPPTDDPSSATMVTLPTTNLPNENSEVASENDAQLVTDTVEEPADEPSPTIVTLPEATNNQLSNADIINDVSATSKATDEVGNAEGKDTGETNDANNISVPAEHTQEEAEWLSMGLSLGDALRQIVSLTYERDSALALCQEKDDSATQAESLLVEVQARLETEMNRRAESDSKARKLLDTMKTYEARLESYEKMEDDLEIAQANLVTAVSEKSKLELEIAKLREVKDESERKEAVLSNRLNEAKKKEANKSNTAGRLELDNEELRANLESTKTELETITKAKTKLEGTMEKLKTKAVERVKQAETALKEERELNEERKKKMKVFVETKAEELREAKESAGDMQKELQETRASLTSSREREESIQKELESARIKYREVQRDMERMKRNAEALHNMGNNLEQELEKSANETEEHKKKRISAKHELMTMMRTLEVERGVSEKLREAMKFTFAPKAQSQQQLLSECLRDFEQELDRLSLKLGKSLMPQSQTTSSEPSKIEESNERSDSNGSAKKGRRGRASKADVDTERLVSNLEQETQHVSKGIMALVSSIERMRMLLDEDNSFNCMAFLSQLGVAIGTGEAKHQRLDGESPHDDREEHTSMSSFDQR